MLALAAGGRPGILVVAADGVAGEGFEGDDVEHPGRCDGVVAVYGVVAPVGLKAWRLLAAAHHRAVVIDDTAPPPAGNLSHDAGRRIICPASVLRSSSSNPDTADWSKGHRVYSRCEYLAVLTELHAMALHVRDRHARQAIMQRTGHAIRLRNTERPPTASAVGV
ncbi:MULTISPECIES: hypothetical protein [unclassified Frankia]|uniref:hypothetical protein n=1 Tax=unclassified Frankia TaxID=2632575 RepID=UPI002AD354B5|nr:MULTISPECIES: hypothetical protein [unclassified Frankia]